jgi:ferredoxin-nitrite reductase
MSGDFSPEQKRYLEGFVSGLQIARATRAAGGHAARTAAVQSPDAAAAQYTGPDAVHLAAQDRVVAAGGKLADQEQFKREQQPFEAFEKL